MATKRIRTIDDARLMIQECVAEHCWDQEVSESYEMWSEFARIILEQDGEDGPKMPKSVRALLMREYGFSEKDILL